MGTVSRPTASEALKLSYGFPLANSFTIEDISEPKLPGNENIKEWKQDQSDLFVTAAWRNWRTLEMVHRGVARVCGVRGTDLCLVPPKKICN